MTWDGDERRELAHRRFELDPADLDMTWQRPMTELYHEFQEMRNDLIEHMRKEDDNSKAIAAISRDVKSLLNIKEQTVGGWKVSKYFGVLLVTLLTLVAAFWDHLFPPK